MTETEQLELPLAVQPSDFKQTEFPWRILCEQKVAQRKRSAVSGAHRVRPTRQASVRTRQDADGFTFLGLAFAITPSEATAVIVAETSIETVKEDPPFQLEV